MQITRTNTFMNRLRALWNWGANLGVENAPTEVQARVRRSNCSSLGYIVSSVVYSTIYLMLGAWKLLALNAALSVMSPLALCMNSKGYYRAARIYQSVSFAIAIAAIICLIGEETYIALLFFPAIASAFVNFDASEKKDLTISLSIAALITLASQLYAHSHDAWIIIDSKWIPVIRVACWVGSIGSFISQIFMFFQSVEESKKALVISHTHMRDMLEGVDDGFYFVDHQWTLLYYNRKAAFYLEANGVKNAEGRNFWNLIESENQRSWVEGLKQAMQTGLIFRDEYFDEIQDYWCEVVGFPSESGMSITFRLISDRKKSELALRESEQLQRAVFDQAPTGLAISTPQGQFQKINPEFCRILGYSEQELIGKFAVDVTVPDEKAQTVNDVNRIASGEVGLLNRQKKYVHKSGRSVPVNLQVRTLRDEQGLPKFNVVSVQDLTDAKLSEQKLIQASKMSSLGEMAGSIAHEINSPMAVIQLSAEQLEDPVLVEALGPEEVAAIGKRISDTVVRISKIIKGLKAFSRNAERDAMELAPVKSLIDDTLELCREKFKQKNIELRVGEIASAETLCRPTEISQVLLNLLSNSFDAIELGGSSEKWVEISANQFAAKVSICVTDSGPGIPEAVVQRMHEPFFTTKPTGKGTGLGLSISKGIVETHGGRLYLDSEFSKTRFVIELNSAEIGNTGTAEPSRGVDASSSLKVASGGN